MIRIYKLTNTFLNPEKSYIGKTNGLLTERLKNHIRRSRTGCDREICKALEYYGTMNFKIELLEEVSDDCVFEKENFYIKKFNTHFKDGCGYNMRYEDLKKKTFIVLDEKDNKTKNTNLLNGCVWNKNIDMAKYIGDKISLTIKEKIKNGLITVNGHKHTVESKKKISDLKKKYYETKLPHNTKKWIVEYENNDKLVVDHLVKFLGSKKEYNKITKWCRENNGKFHPKLKMRVYHNV